VLAGARQAPQQKYGVLVAAVLRPEQREDPQLEVVRGPPEQLVDTLELRVCEPERSVERLLDDLRQNVESSREGRRSPPRYCYGE
jgi:hypothetical protein